MFIAYEHISAEGEDASTDGIGATEAGKVADSALSSNLDIGNNDAGIPGNALRSEGDHTGTGPFKPNVVAISLEIGEFMLICTIVQN